MSARRLIVLVIIAAAAYYAYTHRDQLKRTSSAPATAESSATGGSSAGDQCLSALEEADRRVSAAADLVAKGSVDANAFQSSSSDASDAVSSAESRCGGTDEGQTEARAALTTMRTLLGELSTAASSGGSGASEAVRSMDEVGMHVDKARELLQRK